MLETGEQCLRIEVRDPGPGFELVEPAPDPARSSGWGLYLVRELADRWGVERAPTLRLVRVRRRARLAARQDFEAAFLRPPPLLLLAGAFPSPCRRRRPCRWSPTRRP